MITVHASDAHPEFRPGDVAQLVLWDDPSVAIEGTVPELRYLFTRALRLLPVDGTETP